jgi:hypothetical protein
MQYGGMDMQHGYAGWTRSMDMKHEHAMQYEA